MLHDEEQLHKRSMQDRRIGLANTCLRLWETFGPEYGIELKSAVGVGTTIEVRMQRRQEG